MMGCTKPIQVLLACLEKKSEMLALGESSGFVCNLCLTLQQIFFFNYFFFCLALQRCNFCDMFCSFSYA